MTPRASLFVACATLLAARSPAAAAEPRDTADGTRCFSTAECTAGLECIDYICRPPSARPQMGPTRLGGYYTVVPGVAGKLKNDSPAHSVGAQLEVPLSPRTHYRAAVGFEHLDGANGVRLEPLGLVLSYPIADLSGARLFLRPVFTLADVELLSRGGDTAASLSASASLEALLSLNGWYLSLSPVGLSARYLSVAWTDDDTNARGPIGLNWPVRLSLGVQF